MELDKSALTAKPMAVYAHTEIRDCKSLSKMWKVAFGHWKPRCHHPLPLLDRQQLTCHLNHSWMTPLCHWILKGNRHQIDYPKRLDPTFFLKDADDVDLSLMHPPDIDHEDVNIALSSIVESIERFYERLGDLPISIICVSKISECLSKESILMPLQELQRLRLDRCVTVDLRQHSIGQLLTLAIAARIHQSGISARDAKLSSKVCFRMAVERLWQLYAESDELAIPLALLYAQIFLCFSAGLFMHVGY
ncbi:hypothetical protein V1524DRAFT_480048 [Lipomyces starkeyi]